MTKKKELSPELKSECEAAKALFISRKNGLGLTQAKLAEAAEISPAGVAMYLNGTNPLNSKFAAVLSRLIGVAVEEFSPRLAKEISAMAKSVTDQGAIRENAGAYSAISNITPAAEANAELIGAMSAWDSSTPLGDDEVAIPLYKEVELAAGCGATEVIEVPGRLLRFAKSTLREAGVQETNAVCATIKGHSMERLIMDGATIGIDTGSKHIEDGEIYAFDHGGMLRVKYLYRLPGGSVRVRSENDDEFPDEVLTAEQFSHVRMLGWVFWWSTVRRRKGLSIAR